MNQARRISLLAAAGVIAAVGMGVTGAGATGTHPTHALTYVAQAAKTKKLAFTSNYSGNVKILFATSSVTGTMNGAGKGTTLGTGTIVASGATKSFSTSSSSDPLTGQAILKGAGGSLTLKALNVTASTTASTGPTSSAPDPVTISGTVKVAKGTGKFAGATGTLNVHATFSVNTTSGSDTQHFTATIKGSLSLKA